MSLTIEISDQAVRSALATLLERLSDLTPAMQEISEVMMSGVEDAFEAEADPTTGQKWPALTALTVMLRGGRAHPIMQRSGQLIASIQPDYGKDFAAVGTNKVYAKTQHFGAKKGAFGRGKYKSRAGSFPIPWGDIPARPVLGFSAQTTADVLAVLTRMLDN
jgi:phage virion morphogenesis protein